MAERRNPGDEAGKGNPFRHLVNFMTYPEGVPPGRFWEPAAEAIRRLIPRKVARRKGIRDVDDGLVNAILIELVEEKEDVEDWSNLSADNFGTEGNAALRKKIMLAMERVLDRRRPDRQPIDVRKGIQLNFDLPSQRCNAWEDTKKWLMSALTKLQRSIVGRVVFGGESFRSAAKELGISEELARQIYAEAIDKLRKLY